jgi:phage terminase large subunit-like protein
MKTEVVFRPQPHQVIPQLPDALTLIFQAGRGTGKTWNGCRWLLTNALQYPGTTWLAVAQTWRDALRILAEGSGGLKWHVMGDDTRPNLEFALRGGSWASAFVRSPGAMACSSPTEARSGSRRQTFPTAFEATTPTAPSPTRSRSGRSSRTTCCASPSASPSPTAHPRASSVQLLPTGRTGCGPGSSTRKSSPGLTSRL